MPVNELSEEQAVTNNILPDDLKRCLAFHGHLCPGLVYGYLVAKEAILRLELQRSKDEEIVVVSENDTCAVDALQVLLGTTMGKGNLILKDYGKNVYTCFKRADKRAFRFSRNQSYEYGGEYPREFAELEADYAAGQATVHQRRRQKYLKALDLLAKPFEAVFNSEEINCPEPPYAPLAPSEACADCGEMTMATKMIQTAQGKHLCFPCSQKSGFCL